MARAPFQVLIILYQRDSKTIKYCIFERKNPLNQIQFIAGGGEDGEAPIEAAARELREETGITNVSFLPLKSLCHVPTNIFSETQRKAWGKDLYVIPEYSFGAEIETTNVIRLSDEHVGFRWVTYEEARGTLKWDSNKTALYELNSILQAPGHRNRADTALPQ